MDGHRTLVLSGAVLVIFGAAVAVASGPSKQFRSAGASQTTTVEDSCPARDFDPFTLAWLVDEFEQEDLMASIRCTVKVRDGGKGRKGVKVTLGGAVVDSDGHVVRSFPDKTRRTNRAGQTIITYPAPPPGSDDLAVIMEGLFDGDVEIDSVDTTCGIVHRTRCNNTNTQACLTKRRFLFETNVPTFNGPARVIDLKNNQASFAFGSQNQADLVVQLLNRCSNNDHFWVFASANTNVDYDLTVTDTFTGESRAYSNPGALEPILDTAAFATCP